MDSGFFAQCNTLLPVLFIVKTKCNAIMKFPCTQIGFCIASIIYSSLCSVSLPSSMDL